MLILGVVVVAGIAVFAGGQGAGPKRSTPTRPVVDQEAGAGPTYVYSRQRALFTRAELNFYRALQAATTDRYQVLGKVRVADVLKPQTKNRSDWARAFNKISAKHFDFVLCDRNSLRVVAAVELDDSSHQRSDRIKRDDFLNQAVQSAGLPLIRFPVQPVYEQDAIQHRIAQTLSLPDPETQPKPKPKAKSEAKPNQVTPSPKPKLKPKSPPLMPHPSTHPPSTPCAPCIFC
ncbi:DUF2726 domain-containing protein [Leptolyngbya sp. KIOST-1]|uniref:DUF2726 domain-containing protein n=1 Tax=Leptolyngbya sp. KIOST-1 TaxID=1229172 RepID=UPI001CEC5746|nr:DUF2726 domain-containing protein [Leptolyngbya sp. KIOST-1]